MAGTATITTTTGGSSSPYLATYAIVLISAAGGDVSGHATTLIAGQLVQVKVQPATNITQPSDLFDLTLLDPDGVDLLSGAGANMSNVTSAILVSDPPVYLTGTVDPVLANAGSAKGVTVTLYVKPY